MKTLHILIVEDEPLIAEIVGQSICRGHQKGFG